MADYDEKSPPLSSPAALRREKLLLQHMSRQAQAIIDLQKQMIGALEGSRPESE